MPAAADSPFAYAILRLVPRVERGERLNVGVVLFCRQHGGFLALSSGLDEGRLAALAPGVDAARVAAHLHTLELVAAGDPAGGPLAALEPSERFGWLVAPSSTMIQPSEVHTGVCADPGRELADLFDKLVA